MQAESAKSKNNPDYTMRVFFFIKLHTFVSVFLAPVVHMCLYVVVDQIMLLPSNQMEWILVYYSGSELSYGMWVSAEESRFGFLPRCMDLRQQS